MVIGFKDGLRGGKLNLAQGIPRMRINVIPDKRGKTLENTVCLGHWTALPVR